MLQGLPWWLSRESIYLQCRRPGFNPWLRKIPWRRKWQHTPVLLPRKAHGWRSLLGYSPWGCKELDTTERLHSLRVGKHSLCPGEPQNLVSNLDLVSSEFQMPVSSSLLDSSICQTSWASQAQCVKNLTPSLALPPTQVYPHSNVF